MKTEQRTVESVLKEIDDLVAKISKQYNKDESDGSRVAYATTAIRSFFSSTVACWNESDEGGLILRDITPVQNEDDAIVVDYSFAPKRVSAMDTPVQKVMKV